MPTERRLLVDATAMIVSDAGTGIQRVVREILAQLLAHPPEGFSVELVYGDMKGEYRIANRYKARVRGGATETLRDEVLQPAKGDIFLGLDHAQYQLAASPEILRVLERELVPTYFVVYDLLPVLRPVWFNSEVRTVYKKWLELVCTNADGLVCISNSVAEELRHWLGRQLPRRNKVLRVGHFHLGSDFETAKLDTSRTWWAEPSDKVIQDVPVPLTRALIEAYESRADLQRDYSIGDRDGRARLALWHLNHGHLESMSLRRSIVSNAAVLEHAPSAVGGQVEHLPPFLELIWLSRNDLQSAFDLDSKEGLQGLVDWWSENGAASYPGVVQLFLGPTTSKEVDAAVSEIKRRTSFLMVGTLEPRKGYAQTLDAFERLWVRNIPANLVVVGQRGWMVDDLIQRLAQHAERGRRLFWFDRLEDGQLNALYEHSSALLVASEGEGFGLPIVEAARFDLPVVARDLPVFREVAGDHAVYFSGNASEDLVQVLLKWMELHNRGHVPSSRAIRRLTWRQSAAQLVEVVLGDRWDTVWRPRGTSHAVKGPSCSGTGA